MNFNFANNIKLIVSLLIGAGLIWYLQRDLSEADKDLIILSFKNLKPGITILAIVLGIVACIIRALRWEMLLKPLGYAPRRSTLLGSIFVMYLANLLFPRLGEVLRCTLLQKHEDIPMEKSLGTMIIERIIDVIGMAVIAFLAIVLEKDKFIQIYQTYQAEKGEGSHTLLYIVLGLGIIGFLVLVLVPKIRNFILEKLNGLLVGAKSILNLEHPLLFIIYSILIYTIYFLTTYIMYYSLIGLETMDLKSALLILTAGTLGIGLTQGGIGAFQLLVTKALELYSIPRPTGLAYSWISWIVQTFNLVFFGLISWIALNLRKNK